MFLASEIPPGTGFGFVSQRLRKHSQGTHRLPAPSSSKYDLAERSFHIARNVLGRHVGKQDEYAAAFGGLNFITFRPEGITQVEPLELDAELMRELQSNLLLYFTGSAHHSWAILEEQEKSTRGHTGTAVEALHEVRVLADRMRGALEKGKLTTFGSLLDEAWQAKKRMSSRISTSRIDQLYHLAREHGALGGKITGAGGGGACSSASRIIRKLYAALATEVIHEMALHLIFKAPT